MKRKKEEWRKLGTPYKEEHKAWVKAGRPGKFKASKEALKGQAEYQREYNKLRRLALDDAREASRVALDDARKAMAKAGELLEKMGAKKEREMLSVAMEALAKMGGKPDAAQGKEPDRREYKHQWYLANRERVLAKCKAYRAKKKADAKAKEAPFPLKPYDAEEEARKRREAEKEYQHSYWRKHRNAYLKVQAMEENDRLLKLKAEGRGA